MRYPTLITMVSATELMVQLRGGGSRRLGGEGHHGIEARKGMNHNLKQTQEERHEKNNWSKDKQQRRC